MLRQAVLRPGRKLSDCIYEGDDDNTTAHFGAIENEEIIGIISVYQRPNLDVGDDTGFQIRAMATALKVRGKGVGLDLLRAGECYAAVIGAHYVWANARATAIGFYRKAAYDIDSQAFEIEGVGSHYLVNRYLVAC